MKTFIKESVFLLIASVLILPLPTLVFAYMTNKTVWQILYR